MSAAEDMRGGPSRQEVVAQAPKLELVKPPEASLDQQIEALARRQQSCEANLMQLGIVLGSYKGYELVDPEEQRQEAEQKALLEAEIEESKEQWHQLTAELNDLKQRQRTELASAWGNEYQELPAKQSNPDAPVSAHWTEAQTIIGDPFGVEPSQDRSVEGSHIEQSQEAPAPKEALKQQLAEKRAELEAARREQERVVDAMRAARNVIEGQLAGVDQEQFNLAMQRQTFERHVPVYTAPELKGINLTNAELARGKQPPSAVYALEQETNRIAEEVKAGPPKGFFGKLTSAFSRGPSWSEREKTLKTREDNIDVVIQEYRRAQGAAKRGLAEYDVRSQTLQLKKEAIESDANPDYAKYVAAYAAEEESAKKLDQIYTIVKSMEEALNN